MKRLSVVLFACVAQAGVALATNYNAKWNNAERDPRFSRYRLKDVTEAGSRCLQLVPGAGMTIIIR